MTELKDALETYHSTKDLPENEKLEWVKAVQYALNTGDTSIISNELVWFPWVRQVYDKVSG